MSEFPAVPATAQDLLAALIEAQVQQFAPLTAQWLTPAEQRAGWQASLEPEIERLYDAEFATEYQKNWPVVPDPHAYNNHLWTLEGGLLALSGIRCRRLDPERPFVDAIALSALPTDEAALVRVARELAAPYAAFAPKHVRFLRPETQAMDLSALPAGSHLDLKVVAAPLSEMNRQARVPAHDLVELRRPASLDFYPRYFAEYEALHAAYPVHREYSHPQTEESLAGTLEEGCLFEILVGGQWAGVTAVYRDSGFGVSGFVVQEMLLGAASRGQGLGSAVQQQLAHALAPSAQPGDLLWGTIHADNHAALRAAAAAGRQPLATQLWVALA